MVQGRKALMHAWSVNLGQLALEEIRGRWLGFCGGGRFYMLLSALA